jgi:hypothetical protein
MADRRGAASEPFRGARDARVDEQGIERDEQIGVDRSARVSEVSQPEPRRFLISALWRTTVPGQWAAAYFAQSIDKSD